MPLPLHLAGDHEFRAVREFLDASNYTEPNATGRMGMARLDHIGRFELIDHATRDRNLRIRDPLGALVRLFLAGWVLEDVEIQELIPARVLAAMNALGLVEPCDGRWVSPVMLYPSAGLYLTSDRFVNPDGSEPETASDFVFLTLQRTGADFLANVPGSPCGSFLDLGTGNGVAGLWAARNCARHVWAVDITERAVHFAEFDCRLNGIENVTVLKGDLYEPVAGLQFDRIAIHPPYSIGVTNYVYAYGGEDGEWITRRAIEGLPAMLAPGGVFYCWTSASDRRGAALEQRVREMLGLAGAPGADDFDVAILVEETQAPDAYAIASIVANKAHPRELARWRELFARLEMEKVVYGGILIRRHPRAGLLPFTLRRLRSAHTTRDAADWLLQWESIAAQPAMREELLFQARPAPAPGAELHVRHRFRDGELAPVEYAFRSLHPFDATLPAPAWLAYVFSRCDGKRTGAELFAEVAARLPAEAPRVRFSEGLGALVSGGFLEIEGFRPPATPAAG
jgi:SAM-dependent methyltransferase